MKRSNYLVLSILVLVLTAAGTAKAQSTDRDNPTPITSNEITGSFIDHQKDDNKENFYSFTAGPGELTITFDVKRRRQGDMASISFELLPRNGSSTALHAARALRAARAERDAKVPRSNLPSGRP